MGDLAKAGAAVVCCVLLLGQCKADTGTALKTGAGAAGVGAAVGVGIGAGAAAGGAIGGAKKGASKRAEDWVSGRTKPTKPRPQPNGPSRPMPATTVPMTPAEKQEQCAMVDGLCVVVKP